MNILRGKIDEVTALKDTAHGWFKESLVIYFSTMVSDKQIEIVEAKLGMKDAEQAELPPLKLPKVSNFDNYGLGKNTLPGAIQHLSEDVVLKGEKKFYYNAISIAKLIRDLHGGVVDPKKIDMGTKYDSIRSKAIELTKDMELTGITPDKWCPADIFIYNDLSAVPKAANSKFLNVGKDSLNGFFQSNEKERNRGILGVSLKEEKAQAGAATSFKNILSRTENYPDSEKIKNYDVLSVIYHYDNFVENPNKAYYFSNLAYAYASAKKLQTRGISEAKDVVSALETTFKKTLGKYLPTQTRTGAYAVNSIRSAFEESGVTEVKVSKKLTESIEAVTLAVQNEARKEYVASRKKFMDDLKAAGYDVPAKLLDPKKLSIRKALSKAGCYKTASYVLDGLAAGMMRVPKTFATIAKQKDPFVAMVAFGVGMGGISPTFFKMIGSASPGGMAHIEPFYGNGFLHLDDKSKVEIKDPEGRSGFIVEFISKVTMEESRNSKTLKKYKVIVNYHSAGDQITVLINQFKGQDA